MYSDQSLTPLQDVLDVCDIFNAGGAPSDALLSSLQSRRDGLGAAVKNQCGNTQGTFVCDFVKSRPSVAVGITSFLTGIKASTTFFDACLSVSYYFPALRAFLLTPNFSLHRMFVPFSVLEAILLVTW